MSKPKITKADKMETAKIRATAMYVMYTNGHSMTSIAKTYGITKQRVSTIFKRYGFSSV